MLCGKGEMINRPGDGTGGKETGLPSGSEETHEVQKSHITESFKHQLNQELFSTKLDRAWNIL